MYNFFLVVRTPTLHNSAVAELPRARGLSHLPGPGQAVAGGGTTQRSELAVSFRIFKINCKLIGWVFCFAFGGFCLFVLRFSY